MALIIINLETRYLSDGSLHISSPDVPGFHVVDNERKKSREQFFFEKALPVLQEIIGRRAVEAKIGERAEVRWKDILDVKSIVPSELARGEARRSKVSQVPRQLIAEIT
jgi:hypothetical protein